MLKFTIFFVSFFLSLLTAPCQTNSYKRQVKTITLTGTGFQRGLQYGSQLKNEIAGLMVLWKKDLENNIHIPADTFIKNFLRATNFIPAIEKYTPDIYEEVKGIAEGSGQSLNDIFAFQLPDEYWVFEDQLAKDTIHHHCSAIGIPGRKGRAAYVSQNMDVDSWMDGYQIILHIQQNGNTPEQYILTCAGIVALNGLNSAGAGVCVNTLIQLKSSNDGLPVAFMIRGLLQKQNEADALEFLKKTKHASGQNYILGFGDSVYDYEASANKVIRMYPDTSGIISHTNHPVVNDDVKPWYHDYYQQYLAGNTQNGNSEIRFASLKKRTRETGEKDDGFIKTTLRSKDNPNNPVCRAHLPGKHGFTFGSVILVLSNKHLMEVTAGPPDESEYQTLSFVN